MLKHELDWTTVTLYLSLSMFLAECLVSVLMAVLSARWFFLGHWKTWCRLTSALHMIHHWHHCFSVSGSFIYVFNLHHLEWLRRKVGVMWRNQQYNKTTFFLMQLLTCKYLVCVTTGTHCRLLVLQQPEQRCTSTHGGHNRKLALLRSNIALVTSTTSVRTLHRACWAGWASEGSDMNKYEYDWWYWCYH